MRSIIRARLRSDELAQLLEELKFLRRLTYTQMCDVLALPRKSHNRLQKHMLGTQSFSFEEIQAHVARLDADIRDQEWVELGARLPMLVRSIYSPPIDLPNALSGWLGLDGTQRAFQTQRTGEEWVGIIFQKENLIFSFGKARHGVGFRSTILSPENRGTDRFDMFGARLGLQESPESPYAYPIYCYQLKRPRMRSEIVCLTGYKSTKDTELVQQINGLERIVARLQSAAGNKYGVFGKPSA